MNLSRIILPDRMKLERWGNDPVVRCDTGQWGYLALRNAAAFLATKLTEGCVGFVSPGLYAYIRKVLGKDLKANEEVAVGIVKIVKVESLTHFSFSIRS